MKIAVEHERDVVCIWHDHCTDGMASAWVVHHHFGAGNVEFIGGVYGKPAPRDDILVDKHVYLVDFSYDASTLRHIALIAKSVTILDHHKTAELNVQPLLDEGTIQGAFSSEKSGALLTWCWFFPEQRAPIILEHVSDRDLWRFDLEDSREIEAALSSYPMELEVWDELMVTSLGVLITQGEAILRSQRQKMKQHLVSAKHSVELAGYTVPIANCPYAWASEVGETLCIDKPFSITFVVQADNVKFSLRSQSQSGVDVSEVAKRFGGGGHSGASGFEADFDFLKKLCGTNAALNSF